MSEWISVKGRLPENGQDILFVVCTPAWHDITDELPPEERYFLSETKTVFGNFRTDGLDKRFWSWEDEMGTNTIKNEYEEEPTGMRSYITHWMPLPEPPEEEA